MSFGDDSLEEFYGVGEARLQPGAASMRSYGPPPPVPDDSYLLPSEAASNLDTPIWPRRFASVFPFKTGRALSKVASLLLPTVPVGVVNPEDLYPDELYGWAFAGSAQLAAQTSVVVFYNMLNSGLRIIVEEWQACRINTAGFINVLTAIVPPDNTWTGSSNRFRDSRRGAGQGLDSAKVLVVAGNTTANANATKVPDTLIGKVASGVGTNPAISRQPVILDPGSGIAFEPEIVNEGINVSFWYRVKLIQVAPNKVP